MAELTRQSLDLFKNGNGQSREQQLCEPSVDFSSPHLGGFAWLVKF